MLDWTRRKLVNAGIMSLGIAAASSMLPSSAQAVTSKTDNKALIDDVIKQVFQQKQLETIDRYVAANYIEHNPEGEQGREGFKNFFAALFQAFPDLKIQVDQMLVDGDKVVLFLTSTGTHKGEYFGILPTGHKFTMKSADMYRIANGQLVEHWDVVDSLDFRKQLGMLS